MNCKKIIKYCAPYGFVRCVQILKEYFARRNMYIDESINCSNENCDNSQIVDKLTTEESVCEVIQDWNSFDDWFCNSILNAPASPKLPLASSFDWDSKYGLPIRKAMDEVEAEYAEDLLKDIKNNKIEGDIVEFGVFKGAWIEKLWNSCERIGLNKKIIGFDSFEGLPEPGEDDYLGWEKGQFAVSYNKVCDLLKVRERQNIQLVKGWFSDSFKLSEIQAIEKICYARIDSDLYQPAVECLEFLKTRLVDGAILVFDDWSWGLEKGETKALLEWLPDSGLQLEFLAYNGIVHLYFRVHKK